MQFFIRHESICVGNHSQSLFFEIAANIRNLQGDSPTYTWPVYLIGAVRKDSRWWDRDDDLF